MLREWACPAHRSSVGKTVANSNSVSGFGADFSIFLFYHEKNKINKVLIFVSQNLKIACFFDFFLRFELVFFR